MLSGRGGRGRLHKSAGTHKTLKDILPPGRWAKVAELGSSPDVQDEECGHDGIDTVTESFHPLFAERCVQINTEGLHIVSWRLPVACDMPREENSLGGGLSDQCGYHCPLLQGDRNKQVRR